MRWIDEAKKHIGLREVVGTGNNPAIVQFWKDIKRGGIKDDATPWCAAFVGAMLERVGIRSSRFESAKSYLAWGVLLTAPVPGCIVVFTREGGGHVGFIVGQDLQGNLLVLGGNQGDSVNVKAFPLARVSGYRWPSELVPGTEPLPVLAAADFSSNES